MRHSRVSNGTLTLKKYRLMPLFCTRSCLCQLKPDDLLKFWCGKMNLVHKIIGLILYAGHSGKQVISNN